MQTPKRKPGKYVGVKQDPHITQSKYRALQALLKKLKLDQKKSSREVARLAEFGDFSENHAYQMEKGRLRGINQRILETEDMLGRAVIIRKKKSSIVGLGSVVTIECAGRRETYQILGSAETDPGRGVISYTSPLGKVLMGHAAGDGIVVVRGNAEQECRIIAIS